MTEAATKKRQQRERRRDGRRVLTVELIDWRSHLEVLIRCGLLMSDGIDDQATIRSATEKLVELYTAGELHWDQPPDAYLARYA